MTSTKEVHYNISAQTCRVCLETPQKNEAEESLCLQDEIEYNDLKVELWQLLEAVSKVKCSRYDSIWPTQMCQNCTRRLIVAYEFMREVEKSQQILQELYEQERLKQDDEMSQEPTRMGGLQVLQIDTNDIDHQIVIESEQVFLDDYLLDISQTEQQQKDVDAPGQSFLFNCEACPRVFEKSDSLERHTAATHSQTTQDDVIQTCQYCPRIFKHQDGLRRHMLSFHHMLSGESDAETSYEQDSLQNLRHTKLQSSGRDRLARHMRSHRQEDSWKQQEPANKPHPYKCGVCGMNFKSGALLTVHRNNMSHYNYEKINFGDPFGERRKKKQENQPQKTTNERTENLAEPSL